MAKRKPETEAVSDLNVEIPTDVFQRLHVAKAITSKSLREIAREAFEAWLKQHGVTEEKLKSLRK